MEQWYPVVVQMLSAAWRQRWLLVGTAWLVCLGGWAAVSSIPNAYESETRLYVDADAVLTPLLHGLAVDTATSSRVEIMQKTLLSRPNLEKLVHMTRLDLQAASPADRQVQLEKLRAAIKVDAQDRDIFTIGYRNENPQLAHDVVAALLAIFTEEAAGSGKADMKRAQAFLDQQIAAYEDQLRTAEQRRAEFRAKYLDILPVENNGGLSRLDTARLEAQNLEAQLADANARVGAMQQQIKSTPAQVARGFAGPAAPSPELAAAERHLAELRTRYTEQHPDVVAARELVASLRAEPATRTIHSEGGAVSGGGFADQMRFQLIEASAAAASLKARLDTARQERDRLEALAHTAPGVQAEYQNLDRDYTVIRKNYEELLTRRESSRITQAADTTADKMQLRVIDPPSLPVVPVWPNRFLMMSMVLVVGLGAAGALGLLLAQLDQAIPNLRRLRQFGVPVLGGISMVAPSRIRVAGYAQAASLGVAVVLLVAVYGGLTMAVVAHQRIIP